MKTQWKRGLSVGVLLVALSALVGCQGLLPQAQTDPTRFYVLQGTNPSETATPSTQVIALRAVEVPSYLKASKSLVVRTGNNEVRYLDYQRWAETLDAGLARLLKEGLVAEGVVMTPPLPKARERAVDVFVRVIRCEGEVRDGGARAVLDVGYELHLGGDQPNRRIVRRYTGRDADWNGQDPEALVAALSRLSGAFVRQVAGDVAALTAEEKPAS